MELADTLFVNRSLGEEHRLDTELIATRGDDLCLARVNDFVDDNMQVHLVVVRAAQSRVNVDIDADCDDDQKDALLAAGAKYSAVFDMLANPTEVNVTRRT